MYVEELVYAEGRGKIRALEIDAYGLHTDLGVVVEEAWHLSYPFLFDHEGDLYMVPEASASGGLRAYRCRRFPTEWEPGPLLLEEPVVDATLWRAEDRWWMWAARADPLSPNDVLLVYTASSPLGPWTPHASNPVRVDVRTARPAGRPIRRGGRLLRPVQDCAGRYGSAVHLVEVDALDEHRVAERVVETLAPWDRGLVGLHTWNQDGDLHAMDLLVDPGFRAG